MISGGQSKSFGNASFFVNWDAVPQIASKLPRGLDELRVVVKYPAKNVEGRSALQGVIGYKECIMDVNPARLRKCLVHLRDNNLLYTHVHLDEETLLSLEHERREAVKMGLDDVFKDWDDCEQRFTTSINIDPVAPRDVGRALGDQYGDASVVRNGNAVRPHEVDDLLAQCFPSLFPDGNGAAYRRFRVPLSTAEMLQHTMRFGDPRFTKHYRYLFMMVNVKNLDIGYRSISATLKGRIKKKNMDGTVQDVTEEMIAKFSKVVWRVKQRKYDKNNFAGLREQQGTGRVDSAETHCFRDSQGHPGLLGEGEESHPAYDCDEGFPHCIRDL